MDDIDNLDELDNLDDMGNLDEFWKSSLIKKMNVYYLVNNNNKYVHFGTL